MDEKPNAPEPLSHPGRGGRFTPFLWVFFLLFVVYPLSVGPAIWLHKHAPSTRPVLEAAYTPIAFLCDHCEPVQKAFQWYLAEIWHYPIP